MYRIRKLVAQPTVDFAAEELKKYLRMMMPRAGEIPIDYAPEATDGFRLGLMGELGLDLSDAEDPALDDVIFLDTTPEGGVIAGSNPCALLIAVYRYLRFCGCRWLFPGTDGEWVPCITALHSVSYRKLADHRYRGQCNEGAEYQPEMMESIDLAPKLGMNTYMLEFDVPANYYTKYYEHRFSTCREPEPVNNETVLQWKRQCEAEIQKRGMHFHDMGHGWTAEPFGIDSSRGWTPETSAIPEKMKKYVAQVNGERTIYRGIPLNTNVCMSDPAARRIMVEYIADYAEKQNNVDFLHIWLADGRSNHCECENCRKKTAADWYVLLLNEIDGELTRRGLDTHLVFIVYTETFWPPVEEKIQNTRRFTMLYAPIYRLYTETYQADTDTSAVTPYCRNNNTPPKGMAASLGYLEAWKKMWKGDCFCYEYHFWKHQTLDLSGLFLAEIIYKDIHGLKKHGLRGIVEDGSQRSFFPTGLAFYVYGEALFDAEVSFEELCEDYFSHAFGENWKQVAAYLRAVRDAIPFAYLEGELSADPARGKYYNPAVAAGAAGVEKLVDEFEAVIAENLRQPKRAAAVAWQLLRFHARAVRAFGRWVSRVAAGETAGVKAESEALREEMSRGEIYFERYYDHYLFWMYWSRSILKDLPE